MNGTTPRQILPGVVLLVVLAAAAALAGLLVDEHTADSIAHSRQAWEMRHLRQIIDPALHDNDMANDVIRVRNPDLLGGDAERMVYRAFQGNRPVGAIIETVAPRGYSGPINLLVGVYADGRVAGIRIAKHRETPGLGDRIDLDKSNWLLDFNHRAIGDPATEQWRVRRDGGDFDQFTGATVTPRAVVTAVRDALIYFAEHGDEVFAVPPGESES